MRRIIEKCSLGVDNRILFLSNVLGHLDDFY